jgi:hypothetical protein
VGRFADELSTETTLRPCPRKRRSQPTDQRTTCPSLNKRSFQHSITVRRSLAAVSPVCAVPSTGLASWVAGPFSLRCSCVKCLRARFSDGRGGDRRALRTRRREDDLNIFDFPLSLLSRSLLHSELGFPMYILDEAYSDLDSYQPLLIRPTNAISPRSTTGQTWLWPPGGRGILAVHSPRRQWRGVLRGWARRSLPL